MKTRETESEEPEGKCFPYRFLDCGVAIVPAFADFEIKALFYQLA